VLVGLDVEMAREAIDFRVPTPDGPPLKCSDMPDRPAAWGMLRAPLREAEALIESGDRPEKTWDASVEDQRTHLQTLSGPSHRILTLRCRCRW
jgi:hypothetical protein